MYMTDAVKIFSESDFIRKAMGREFQRIFTLTKEQESPSFAGASPASIPAPTWNSSKSRYSGGSRRPAGCPPPQPPAGNLSVSAGVGAPAAAPG